MMTSTSTTRLELATRFPGMSSRSVGNKALEEILSQLHYAETVELDFEGQGPTPSFADQCVGGLVGRLGLIAFKQRIKIRNAPDEAKVLLRHVIFKNQHAAA